MKVVSSKEMKEIEKVTIDEFGISEELLMERAGISVVQAIWHELGSLEDRNFLIICGSGNNGGDGYVTARDLLNYTEAVRVVSIDEPRSEVSKINSDRYIRHGGIIYKYSDIGLEKLSEMISSADIVIDAIFGTGLDRVIDEKKYIDTIGAINLYSRFTVSIDIPSGVATDTGKILDYAVQADMTVTFGYPKPCHVLFPGRELTGKLKIAKIGIPSQIHNILEFDKSLLTVENVHRPNRPRWSHKGDFGEVIVIGGSDKYIGAPVLSALSAQRCGSGITRLVVPEKSCQCAMSHDPSLICNGIDGKLSADYVNEFISSLPSNAVLLIGPGWSVENEEDKIKILEFAIGKVSNPVIIDADGINILAKTPHLKDLLREKSSSKTIILTPHPGEFSRLTGKPIKEIKQNYQEVKSFSQQYMVITSLKDATTIISDGETIYFNITGNTSLSKAGSGDILSGILAAFLSQHLRPIDAVKTAVYTFGLVGEMIPSEGMNSSFEVIFKLPEVLNKLDRFDENQLRMD
ncbi:MAG TPA: NAD(P)H-hydrate dehydratase [Fervidobacterium sp.]|nr:bifunctional ADP-dependent NAD(P)H-hydrate dehydratase/NAD(P)H-hydrate epimerase [Fervidobacterium sp.]HOK88207.1 NAD(P)H-hydrate dehydratase [Fervidobacterium sp.]HOM74298.1 NAD(P)H-hydrate dehydratase [Fervidobacterium sp.]HOQ39831.1 NAD(P)H-hydrate dehydratase [Fervidobacterium sp.]HPP17986.1 NAD(P)H-hydrate dehydratase [Fervidobacterium sp.]